MLERLGGFAHRFRWWLLGLLLLCTGAGFGYDGTVARHLEPIGMEVKGSEVERVDAILADRFGQHPADVVAVLHDETRTFEDAGYRRIVRDLAAKLRDHPAVLQVKTPLKGATPLVSKSGHRVLLGESGAKPARSLRARVA